VRRLLIVLVSIESVLLLAGAAAIWLGGERLRRPTPDALVFEPAIYSAVIGDSVRYRRVDPKDENNVLGFLDYEVVDARIANDTGLGARFYVKITQIDEAGGQRSRIAPIQPELIEDGFLPPRFDELQRIDVPGGRPVIRTIRTAPVPRRPGAEPEPGFEIETIIPRDGLTEVAERYFISPEVPLFGVVRWERSGEVFLLHRQNREPRRDVQEGAGQ
jgi:hypothetical protein